MTWAYTSLTHLGVPHRTHAGGHVADSRVHKHGLGQAHPGANRHATCGAATQICTQTRREGTCGKGPERVWRYMPVRVLVCAGKDAVLCSGYKHRLWNYTAWVHVQILLCHVLAVWLWLSYLTSLCLSVLTLTQ